MTVTRQLANFAADAAHNALPEPVIHGVRRALLDYSGVAIAGTSHPAFQGAQTVVMGLGTGGTCRIVGSTGRTDAVNAALLNGIAAHVLDWDDTILPTRAHLSAALFPALLAEGERRGWRFSDIASAFAIGFELSSRLNHAVYPSIHLRGWQGTGIVGGIGTAAAIGRLVGLDPSKITHAMGIAATNASGLIATFGSMSKPLNIGRAGASGLQSALLAEQGFTSHPDILGAGKFLELYDDTPRYALLIDGLGSDWAILRNGYKPYPCGFVAHAMIDAVRELRSRRETPAGLKRLMLRVSPESMHLMGNADPTNELEAKFSLLYDAAVAWMDGNVTPAAFEEATVRDPRYRSIMAQTTIAAAPEVAQHEAFASAEFEDGTTESAHVKHARGTPARPMTDDDLLDKFSAAVAMGGMPGAPELADLIMHKADFPVPALMDHLAAAKAEGPSHAERV